MFNVGCDPFCSVSLDLTITSNSGTSILPSPSAYLGDPHSSDWSIHLWAISWIAYVKLGQGELELHYLVENLRKKSGLGFDRGSIGPYKLEFQEFVYTGSPHPLSIHLTIWYSCYYYELCSSIQPTCLQIKGAFHLLELASQAAPSINGMCEFWELSELVLAKLALLIE